MADRRIYGGPGAGLSDGGMVHGRLFSGNDRRRNGGAYFGHGRIRTEGGSVVHTGDQSGQTFDGRRGRYGDPRDGAHRGGGRRSRREDVGAVSRLHWRDCGQTVVHSGISDGNEFPRLSCAGAGTRHCHNRAVGGAVPRGRAALCAPRRDGDSGVAPADRFFHHEQEDRFRRGCGRAGCQVRPRRFHEERAAGRRADGCHDRAGRSGGHGRDGAPYGYEYSSRFGHREQPGSG